MYNYLRGSIPEICFGCRLDVKQPRNKGISVVLMHTAVRRNWFCPYSTWEGSGSHLKYKCIVLAALWRLAGPIDLTQVCNQVMNSPEEMLSSFKRFYQF